MGWHSIIFDAEIVYKAHKPTVVFLITDEEGDIKASKEIFTDSRLILATSKRYLKEKYSDNGTISYLINSDEIERAMIFKHFQRFLTGLLVKKAVDPEDIVLTIFHNSISFISLFPVSNIGLLSIKDEIGDELFLTAQSAITLLREIAEEGREGTKIGAIFTIGDEEKVLEHSTQLVVNPFKGHPEEERDIHRESNRETFKEFSLIDGAFILNKKGVAVSCGRLLFVDVNMSVPSGLGSRHIAAATVSSITESIVVVLSTSGSIRIYKKGQCIYTMEAS